LREKKLSPESASLNPIFDAITPMGYSLALHQITHADHTQFFLYLSIEEIETDEIKD